MANAFKPGGGYLNGVCAQEEDLCRRSTLFPCLQKFKYPIPQSAVLYHRAVLIFRNTNYSIKPRAWTATNLPVVSVISAATIERPALSHRNGKDVYANPEDQATQMMVCQTILRVAAKCRHRVLVLGAIGCGAFCHPVEEAVNIWKDVLGSPEFKGWFENVNFAVLSTRESTPGDPSHNFTAFQDGLEDLLVGERGVKLIQPKRKRVPRLDLDAANFAEPSLPKSRAAARARSASRTRQASTVRASVEPVEDTKRPTSRTRSSTRICDQSRTRAVSGVRASPRRKSSVSLGRGRWRQTSAATACDRTRVYRFLIPVLVIVVAYVMLHFAEFCWFVIRRRFEEQRRRMK